MIDATINRVIARLIVDALTPFMNELERTNPITQKLYKMRMRNNPSKYKRFYVRRGCV